MAMAAGAALGVMSAIYLYVGGLVGATGFLGGGYLLIRAAKYDGKRAALFALAGLAVMAALLPLARFFPMPD
ncbi:hypothetical protein [Actinomadura chokoriensis]|uniref:Uncharacterized protein n=1 Tax=Actinomadura chokoriensis TaxID=454156 RepID=A0ABV4RA63_9ACTN